MINILYIYLLSQKKVQALGLRSPHFPCFHHFCLRQHQYLAFPLCSGRDIIIVDIWLAEQANSL
ncbi:MAG: hypothetical protein K0Q79_2263 [Flavipsychrobacter sp.]|jgi:hypothetical protein|nr:hypothetical protein [Flavipsychrobacter sp.]